MCSMCRATRGKSSLMRMLGTEVGMSRNRPPLTCDGFGSKVSNWLAPPVIHRRMHDLHRLGLEAVSLANALNQPETPAPVAPAAASRSQSRRVIEACRAKSRAICRFLVAEVVRPRIFAGSAEVSRLQLRDRINGSA